MSSSSLYTIEDDEVYNAINGVAAVQQTEISRGGYSPLHIAARTERIDAVKWLLKQPTIRKAAKCFTQLTPLGLACFFNKEVDCILALIAAGCDINADDYPIILLITNKFMQLEKKKRVIEVMIKEGLDLDEPTMLERFIKCYDGTEECLEMLHLLLYYNIDVNANGAESLTIALKYGHFDICDILWDYIADFTLNSNGLLIESIRQGYKFNEMIEKGVNISKANILETAAGLQAIFQSKDTNALEILNTLWTHSHRRNKIDRLIYSTNLATDLHEGSYKAINKECVIRYFHLFFDFVFESKTDLFDSFDLYDLYKVLEGIALDKDEIIQLFYLHLMCASRISYCNLFSLYQECHKDVFETFLKVNVHIEDEYLHMDHILAQLPRNRQEYTEFDCILFPDLLPLDMEDEKVTSLVKLSRNVIRKQFQPDYETMKRKDLVFFRYYNMVNKMDLPKRIKDILLLNSI